MTKALRHPPLAGDNAHPPVPARLAPFVQVLGEAEAVRFFLTFGGTELYLAESPTGRSRLEAEFGSGVTARLKRVADDHLLPRRIPTAKPWIARVWASQGLPHAEIARRLHIADSTVRRILARSDDDARRDSVDPRQMKLF